MTIGAGIAVAGAWIFAGMMGLSRTITGKGVMLAIGIAIGVTIYLGA